MRKLALLGGVAALTVVAGPALAQNAPTQPQTPPASPRAAAPTQQPQSVTLQPGSTVRSADGTELGELVGARPTASGGQELTVRGADGQVRAVPLAGLRQEGTDVVVDMTGPAFQAATVVTAEPPVAGEPPATTAAPPAPDQPATEPAPADPAQPSQADDPMEPGEGDQPD